MKIYSAETKVKILNIVYQLADIRKRMQEISGDPHFDNRSLVKTKSDADKVLSQIEDQFLNILLEEHESKTK